MIQGAYIPNSLDDPIRGIDSRSGSIVAIVEGRQSGKVGFHVIDRYIREEGLDLCLVRRGRI